MLVSDGPLLDGLATLKAARCLPRAQLTSFVRFPVPPNVVHTSLVIRRGLQVIVEGAVQATHGPGQAMELEMCAAARLRNLQHLQLIDKDK